MKRRPVDHTDTLVRIIRLASFNLLHKVNLAPQVTKMLCACDEIIRQHKAACLRVTSMLACNNVVWIGTSAGVVLTVRVVEKASTSMVELPCVTGRWWLLDYGGGLFTDVHIVVALKDCRMDTRDTCAYSPVSSSMAIRTLRTKIWRAKCEHIQRTVSSNRCRLTVCPHL